jgi:hypothetical protein
MLIRLHSQATTVSHCCATGSSAMANQGAGGDPGEQ